MAGIYDLAMQGRFPALRLFERREFLPRREKINMRLTDR